jgi:pimeloyl-ACP methyl ester carboxylesterase
LVVGHSLGGTIALIAEIAGMPTVDSLAIFEAPMPWLPDYGGRGGVDAVRVGMANGPAAAAEHFMRNMIGDAGWNRLRDADRAARRAEGSALMAELVDVRRPEIEPDLTAIGVPVTVGLGSRSRPHLQAAARALADQLPDAVLVELAEAPHGAHLARPDDFASWVRTARSRVRDD